MEAHSLVRSTSSLDVGRGVWFGQPPGGFCIPIHAVVYPKKKARMIRSEHCSLLPALDRCGCLQDGPTQHRPKDQAQGERDAHSHHGVGSLHSPLSLDSTCAICPYSCVFF